MANRNVTISALNIAASPHPENVYDNFLTRIARKPIPFWGTEAGALSIAKDSDDEIISGLIMLWTHIDTESGALNTTSLSTITPEEIAEIIPDDIGLNLRLFNFAFSVESHLMFFESRSEAGKSLGSRKATALLEKLSRRHFLEDSDPSVEITAVPEDDALARVLSLHEIRKIKIKLKRPNPDTIEDEKIDRILNELAEQGARTQDLEFTKSRDASTIQLNEKNQIIAEVASKNGHVEAKGYNIEGMRDKRSTKEHPKTYSGQFDDKDTSARDYIKKIARLLSKEW